ncbi:hypothetical protein OGAPHI_002210 [Ogataea philodendri]|uniref:Nucleolar pre-ribosomal-associated protein 1 n=1 Tax=Ogataea philodendri TaxID=1378263 RepID=A0A9P8PB11_9ASCO|nr:uncharacterized protein OGAPHI_002210 [Ogataea philodendri]KAH3668456.1 hypothetical protein OGAPHI_002210 [Ogataea philodendri]
MSKKSKYVANVSTDALEQLSVLLDSFEKKKDRKPEDLNGLSSFLHTPSNLISLTQNFSYLSTINEHSGLSNILNKFVKVVRLGTQYQELQKPCSSLIQDIFSSHNIKIFYRCLNNQRPGITNPALRLLTASFEFRKGEFVDTFLDNFDLSLKILPQLLNPSKAELEDASKAKNSGSIRYNFIVFWTTLCSHSSPLTRRDLLANNRKIVTNWFKHIASHDSTETIQHTLKFLDEAIVQERTYKKMTKCKIFGDFIPRKLLDLYAIESVSSNVHQFLLTLATDYDLGLVFAVDRSSDSSGVPVTVGEQTFRIHNKLIYGLLTGCKPWTSEKQLDLVVSVLSAVPELIPCYNYHLSHTIGVSDPKLSMLYVAESWLLTKIIRIPIPEKLFTSTRSVTTLVEYICPNSLRRTSLSKNLTSNVSLVRHIGSQLIIDVLQKLEKSFELIPVDIRDEVMEILQTQRLPDLSSITGALNECYKVPPYNKLLIVNLLKACEYYQSVLAQTVSLNLPKLNLGQEENFESIDLVILDSYLKINADSQQNKWTTTGSGKNSLFTTILRLPYRLKNSGMDNKVVAVISNLIDSTLAFTDYKLETTGPLASQAWALVYSLDLYSKFVEDDCEIDAVCKILDESIARVMRTPYKYVDVSREFGEPVSPFYVAVIEQSKFATSEKVLTWINLFSKYMFLLGEPLESMKQVINRYWQKEVLDFEEYENSLNQFCSQFYKDDNLLFFEKVVNYPVSLLKKTISGGIATTDFDIVCLFRRIEIIASDDSLKLQDIEDLVVELISKIGNYLVQQTNVKSADRLDFFKSKYWNRLYLGQSSNEKQLMVAKLLDELFYGLFEQDTKIKAKMSDYQSFVRKYEPKSPEEETIIADSLWILNNDEIIEKLSIPGTIGNKAFELAVAKRIELDAETVVGLADLINEQNFQNYTVLSMKVKLSLIQIELLLQKAESNPLIFYALSSLLQTNSEHAVHLATKIPETGKSSAYGLRYLVTLNKYAASPELQQGLVQIATEELAHFFESSSSSNVSTCVEILADSASYSLFSQLVDFAPFYKNAAYIFGPESAHLVSKLPSNAPVLKKWCSKAILYITRTLAEKDVLSSQFLSFLLSLQGLLKSVDIWKIVQPSSLNAQLETLFSGKWVQNEVVMKYSTMLLMNTSSKAIQSSKHIQILANNTVNVLSELPSKTNLELRYHTALSLYYLSQRGPVTNFDVVKQVLQFYTASLRADDLVLKQVLKELENGTGQSWMSLVASWEFYDTESYEPYSTGLITSISQGLIVNLSKKFIENSISRFRGSSETFQLPNGATDWQQWQDFYRHNAVVLGHLVFDNIYAQTVYDPEFLMLLVINNDELFQPKDSLVTVDVRRLAESGLLQFVVMNLANCQPETRYISRKILSAAYSTLDSELKQVAELKEDSTKIEPGLVHLFSFKDRATFKVYLGNLLTSEEDLAPVVTVMLSHLVPILNNPAHFLYEKTYRFILGGSKFRSFDIPLLKAVTQQFVTDKHLGSTNFNDDYYKQLSWLLTTLTESLTHRNDLKVVNRSGILEYIMAITGSPYLTFKLQQEILRLIHRVSELPNGADLLVRSCGVLGFAELQKLRLSPSQAADNYRLLDLQNLAVKTRIMADDRVYEWTSNDLDHWVSRVLN